MDTTYEAPALTKIGTLHELTTLTLTNKNALGFDGLVVLGVPIPIDSS
ncbi:MAG: lasso RiPP family leader peptide-containing protein [Pseudonocardiaceae bacterium]